MFSLPCNEMTDFTYAESHIRNCALFFCTRDLVQQKQREDNLYGDVLKVSICWWWLRWSGRAVKFDDDVWKYLVESDPRLSVQELSKSLGSTCTKALTWNRQSTWIPRQLYEANKDLWRTVCTSLLARLRADPFLSRIVAGEDESSSSSSQSYP